MTEMSIIVVPQSLVCTGEQLRSWQTAKSNQLIMLTYIRRFSIASAQRKLHGARVTPSAFELTLFWREPPRVPRL